MTATTPSVSSPRARHRSPVSRWRQGALIVLSAGAVLSLGAAFGPVWLIRAGVLAALLTAVLVHRFARAELAEAHADHARRSDRAHADHRSAIEREHRGRRRQADRIDDLERQVMALHGEVVALGALNHDLSVQVGAQQLRPEPDQPVADVRRLPRRIRRDAVPTSEPGWDNLEVDVAVTG